MYPTKVEKKNDNGRLLTEYDKGLKKHSYMFIDLAKREWNKPSLCSNKGERSSRYCI
ncbi:MAG: hypothetical protein QXM77_07085 [Candidatus Nitrosocaldus sp.]